MSNKKVSLIILTIMAFQSSSSLSGIINFLLSSGAAGGVYLKSQEYENQLVKLICDYKRIVANQLLDAASALEQNKSKAAEKAKEASKALSKAKGDNFVASWWNARKAGQQAEAGVHSAAEASAEAAEAIYSTPAKQVQATVNKYYPYARYTASGITFLVAYKILGKII